MYTYSFAIPQDCPEHYYGPVLGIHADLPHRPDMVVHAPMPLLGQNPLLATNFQDLSPYHTDSPSSSYYPDPNAHLVVPSDQWLPEPPTFPTPSELLVELSSRNGFTPPYADGPSSPITKQQSPVHNVPFGRQANEVTNTKPEPGRKARRRALSHNVGFQTTDPDTISSHEKKRRYLECLEQYVMYLHQLLELLGVSPLPLRRVDTYRGLHSRSIRTLLVHMENTNRELNLKTMAEEQRFLRLREEVMRKELSFNPAM